METAGWAESSAMIRRLRRPWIHTPVLSPDRAVVGPAPLLVDLPTMADQDDLRISYGASRQE